MDWAWENLSCRQLWALVRNLKPESAWGRLTAASTPLEENVATLVDFLVHEAITSYRRSIFDPEKYAEDRELARAAKRNTAKPPALPVVTPVALRPAGARSLTEALTAVPEPVVEEVDGHEAHERLQRLLAG